MEGTQRNGEHYKSFDLFKNARVVAVPFICAEDLPAREGVSRPFAHISSFAKVYTVRRENIG